MRTIKNKRLPMGLLLILVLVFALSPVVAYADSGNQIGSYVFVDKDGNIIDGTASRDSMIRVESGEGTYVEHSKTISGTETEDLFKIDLKVQTNEVREEVSESVAKPHDVIIIMDTSNSMHNYTMNNGNTRWINARNSMAEFIKNFLDGEGSVPGSRVAIGTFAGLNDDLTYLYTEKHEEPFDDHNSKVCDWTSDSAKAISTFSNVSDPKDLNLGKSPGATNMQGGFMAAEEILRSAGSTGNDKTIIFVSDGHASYHYDKDGKTLGAGGGATDADANAAIDQMMELKKNYPKTKIYTFGIGDGQVNNAVLRYKEGSGGVDKFFSAIDAKDIEKTFAEIRETIIYGVKVWTVTDPMSNWVEFTGFDAPAAEDNNNNNKDPLATEAPVAQDVSKDGTAEFENNTITWNLEEVNAMEKDGVYTYELSYYMHLNKKAEGFKSNVLYPTNKITDLTYAFQKDDITNGMSESEFRIPTVKGYVEYVKDDTAKPGDKVLGDESNPGDEQTVLGQAANTNDGMNAMPYVIIMLVAAAVITAVLVYRKLKQAK